VKGHGYFDHGEARKGWGSTPHGRKPRTVSGCSLTLIFVRLLLEATRVSPVHKWTAGADAPSSPWIGCWFPGE